MLRKRIIGVIIAKGEVVVQSIGFERFLPVGSIDVCVEFLDQWGIDEIVLVDIDATREGRRPNWDMVRRVSKRCHVPLTIGGGIKTLDDINKLIHSGADKVVINTLALDSPEVITQAASIFGDQCLVVSIDAKRSGNNLYDVWRDNGQRPAGLSVAEWVERVANLGAGEIFLNSIDRDGSKQGYDIGLYRHVAARVHIPMIACGGAGHPQHVLQVFNESGVSAAAAANFFHYTEHSVNYVKAYLKKAGVNVRLDSYASYAHFLWDDMGRADKIPDEILERLRFNVVHDEVI